jgi:predicted DNA-binding antitoxin AbrB/MazE fold protein
MKTDPPPVSAPMQIPAIYVNGVFQPTQPVSLPERTKVVVTTEIVPDDIGTDSDEIYEILERRYNSGYTDTAARVDELNP